MTTPGGPPRRPRNPGVLAVAGGVVLVVVIGAVMVGGSGDGSGGGSLLPWVLVPLLLVGGLVAETYATRRRHERNRAWAAAQGWTYQAADATLAHRWNGEPFGEGRSRNATEVLRGVYRGHPVTSFTYRWTTGSGKNRTTHTRHVVALDLPASLPTLQLTPEHLGTAVARFFGGQDIRFEHEEFNAEWRVEATDLRFAHGVVHPRLMEALMRHPARGTSMRVGGASVLSWAYGRTDLTQVIERAAVLCTVVDAIPRHVWQDHGWDPEAPVAR
jgi:hypothetical protein